MILMVALEQRVAGIIGDKIDLRAGRPARRNLRKWFCGS